jgi:hypothetical protein
MMSRAILGPREYHQLKLRCFRGFAEVTVVSAFFGVAGLSLNSFSSKKRQSVSESASQSFIHLTLN